MHKYICSKINHQKFNDSNIQNKFLHLFFEKSEDEQICSNNICGACELQEIELCLKLRSKLIYHLYILYNFIRYHEIRLQYFSNAEIPFILLRNCKILLSLLQSKRLM